MLLTLEKHEYRYWIRDFLDDLTQIIDYFSSRNKRRNQNRKIVINIDPCENDRSLIEEALQGYSIRWHAKTKYAKSGQIVKIFLY